MQEWQTCEFMSKTIQRNSNHEFFCCQSVDMRNSGVYDKHVLFRGDASFGIVILSNGKEPECCKTCRYYKMKEED